MVPREFKKLTFTSSTRTLLMDIKESIPTAEKAAMSQLLNMTQLRQAGDLSFKFRKEAAMMIQLLKTISREKV